MASLASSVLTAPRNINEFYLTNKLLHLPRASVLQCDKLFIQQKSHCFSPHQLLEKMFTCAHLFLYSSVVSLNYVLILSIASKLYLSIHLQQEGSCFRSCKALTVVINIVNVYFSLLTCKSPSGFPPCLCHIIRPNGIYLSHVLPLFFSYLFPQIYYAWSASEAMIITNFQCHFHQ